MTKYKNINRFILDRAVEGFAAEIEDKATVLDVGAGSGHYRKYFNGKRYIAVDRGLEQRDYMGLDIVADVCLLPFGDSTVDYIISVEVLEHIFEHEMFLGELNRVIKHNGRILLTAPLSLSEHMRPFDFFRYTRFGLEKAVEEAGMVLERIYPRGGYFIFLSYYLRKFPEYLTSSRDMPALLKKVIKNLLNPIFAYAIPFFLHAFDRFDKRGDITLGYVCIIRKKT